MFNIYYVESTSFINHVKIVGPRGKGNLKNITLKCPYFYKFVRSVFSCSYHILWLWHDMTMTGLCFVTYSSLQQSLGSKTFNECGW